MGCKLRVQRESLLVQEIVRSRGDEDHARVLHGDDAGGGIRDENRLFGIWHRDRLRSVRRRLVVVVVRRKDQRIQKGQRRGGLRRMNKT